MLYLAVARPYGQFVFGPVLRDQRKLEGLKKDYIFWSDKLREQDLSRAEFDTANLIVRELRKQIRERTR